GTLSGDWSAHAARSESGKLVQLKELRLRNTTIKEESLPLLAQMSNLREVQVPFADLRDSMAARMKEQVHNAQTVWNPIRPFKPPAPRGNAGSRPAATRAVGIP